MADSAASEATSAVLQPPAGGRADGFAAAGSGAGKGAAVDFALTKLHLTTDVTVDVLAWALDLSEKRIQQLVQEGTLTKTGRGRYPLAPNVHAYLAYLRARLPGPRAQAEQDGDEDEDGEDLNPVRERALLARSQRQMIDLRRAERERCLIPIDEAERVFGKLVSLVQTKLRSLPTTAAPIVAGQEPHEAQAMLSGLVEEALIELSTAPELAPSLDDGLLDPPIFDDGEGA